MSLIFLWKVKKVLVYIVNRRFTTVGGWR